MTLLVTGGAGFIGANFVLDWLARGNEPIINLDRLTYAGNRRTLASLDGDTRHVFVQGDIADGALVQGLLEAHRPRAIVHFAAESHVDRSIRAGEDFVQTNVVGTFHLLEAARQYWSKLDPAGRQAFRFLHVSTDEVYGSVPMNAPPVPETGRYDPSSPYSATKAASDHLVRAWHATYELPTLVAHCSNNFGPYQYPEKLIPLMIQRALDGQALPVYGDGRQVRDWLFVRDNCSALRRILEAGQVGGSYNVGGGNERMNLDVVRTLCAHLDRLSPRADGRSYVCQIAHVTDRPGHDQRYALDAGKLRRELGWAPEHCFDSALAETVRWYLEHADWIAQSHARRDTARQGLGIGSGP